MTISARNWAWQVATVNLPGAQRPLRPGEKLTLLCIAEFENAEDGFAYPSQEHIAQRTCQDIRTVRRHIKTLAEVNAISIERRRSRNGKWLHNTYVLSVPYTFRVDDPAWMYHQEGSTTSGRVA